MAGPPKLVRRTKGVFGAVLALYGASSSSTALSSIESEFELVERLPRLRFWKLGGVFCCVPERPIVVTERRLRFASLDKGGGPDTLLPRWKRFESAACVMELRRWRLAPSPPFPLASELMAGFLL